MRKGGLIGRYFPWAQPYMPGDVYDMEASGSLDLSWSQDATVGLSQTNNAFKDYVSVVYDGAIMPKESGNYTFYLEANDYAQLVFYGLMFVLESDMSRPGVEVVSGEHVYLEAFEIYEVQLKFKEVRNNAFLKLSWSATRIDTEDDPNPGFERLVVSKEFIS